MVPFRMESLQRLTCKLYTEPSNLPSTFISLQMITPLITPVGVIWMFFLLYKTPLKLPSKIMSFSESSTPEMLVELVINSCFHPANFG